MHCERMKTLYWDSDGKEKEFSDDLSCTVRIHTEGDWLTRCEMTVRNHGIEKKIIPVVEWENDWTAEFYMIPCVNYNGNAWGTGEEPKGTERDGKPWIFSSDRVGLPGCSIAERTEECVGIFASNEGISSNASASIFHRKGNTVQRIYFSHVEYPRVYLRKFEYGDPIVTYDTLQNGASKVYTFYIFRYMKEEKNPYYGYNLLFDHINGEGYYRAIPAKHPVQTVKEWSGEFFRSLTEKYSDGYLSNMGLTPGGVHRLGDENCTFLFRSFGKYEIGWCGQNITAAEMYLRFYLESGDPDLAKKGVGILNNWMKRRYPCGLIGVSYDVPFDGSERIDTCNEGWLLYKLLFCCRLLCQIGADAKGYEDAAQGICSFFIHRYPIGGFPQILDSRGNICVNDGCAGVMVMLGLIEAYKYFGDERCLDRAIGAFDFYYGTYLSKSVAAGGALDTYCIDKESAGPVLRSAILLYEITGEHKYLVYAENIAHYLMTWAFYHDVAFEKESDCALLEIRTTGGTSVSAAHHHIDCWGLFYVPDLYRLYQLTKKKGYLTHARALWTFTVQYISDGNMKLHGMVRPKGAQNEAVIQCNWHGADEQRGQLNDWMVAWVKSFQLDVIYALENTDFFRETDDENLSHGE